MVKIWLGGSCWKITEEQHAAMNDYIKTQLIAPHGTGDRSVNDSEKIALEYIHMINIKPYRSGALTSIIILLATVSAIVDYFFFDSVEGVYGQLLIALITGAGVNTPTPAQTQLESDVIIGDIDTAQPLQGLLVNVDGDSTINIQGSQPLMSVFAKLGQFMVGSGIIGLINKISTGRVFCKAATITFTNSGATTPNVYWNSQVGGNQKGNNGRLIRARTNTIVQNSNQTFVKGDFAYLALTSNANITSFDFTFTDGTQQNMTVTEADALFAKTNETQTDGRLDAVVTVIDNTLGNIAMVRVNVGATAVTYMTVI